MIGAASRDRVLVVDDELGPRESLRILLKPDYDVACAESVASGLQALRERAPDLVIMDIRMPEISGIEGLRMVRDVDPHVAVIMLTGFGTLETAREALRLGANDYLRKPFDTREIREVIRHNIDHTRVNRKRARLEEDLLGLNRKLTEELAARNRISSLGQASAELVHDLRNPLTVALGHIGLLSQDLEETRQMPDARTEEIREHVDIIAKSMERCRDLMETWQSLGHRGKCEPVDVPGLLRHLLTEETDRAARKEVRIELVVSDEKDCRPLGDPVQLSRALQNVIGNAIDALPERGGVLRVACRRADADVVVAVEDNGSGIPADKLDRIFDAYFTTKGPGKGTGLGLFISRKVIEDHGGKIEIQSVEGRGTVVSMTLPLAGAAQGA